MLFPIPLLGTGAIALLLLDASTDAFSAVAAFSFLGKKQQPPQQYPRRKHSSHLYRRSTLQSQRLNDDTEAFSIPRSLHFHRSDAAIPLPKQTARSNSDSTPSKRRTPKSPFAISFDDPTTALTDSQWRMPALWKALVPKMAKPVSLSTAPPFPKLTLGLLVSMIMVFNVYWNDNLNFSNSSPIAWAAPPIAVIAEELGYFPITSGSAGMNGKSSLNTGGGDTATASSSTVYVPAQVKRTSTPQAVDLADYMQRNDIYMAGTYWCPHTRRQKELLGRQATSRITYIECAPLGYQAQPRLCQDLGVEAYPTWIVPRDLVEAATVPAVYGLESNSALKSGNDEAAESSSSPSPTVVLIPGERSLADLATRIGYTGQFSASMEDSSNPPPVLGSNSACK